MRNYDKEPLVIEDANTAFGWNMFKYTFIPLVLIVFILFPLISGIEINYPYTSLLIFGIPLVKLYERSKQRKIILFQNKIEYTDFKDKLSIIDLNAPNVFKKSFQNYYYKKQNISYLYFIFTFFFVSFLMKSLLNALLLIIGAIIVVTFLTLITKYILSERGLLWYSSILVQQGDNVVAIPLFKNKDYQEVRDYLNQHQIDYETLPIFWKVFYGMEESFAGFNIFSSGDIDETVCTGCKKTISKEIFSCPHCGNPQSDKKNIEEKNDDKKYYFKAILKDKDDFQNIIRLIKLQYEPYGYTIPYINKEDKLMLKSDMIDKSYILVILKDYEITIETFNTTELPTIKEDAQEYWR